MPEPSLSLLPGSIDNVRAVVLHSWSQLDALRAAHTQACDYERAVVIANRQGVIEAQFEKRYGQPLFPETTSEI